MESLWEGGRMNFKEGIILVMTGIASIYFRSVMAKWASEENYRILRIRFDERIYQISFLFGGLLFLVIGTLTLCGVIKFK